MGTQGSSVYLWGWKPGQSAHLLNIKIMLGRFMLSSFRVMFWSSCFCGSLQCKPFVDPTVCVCVRSSSRSSNLCAFSEHVRSVYPLPVHQRDPIVFPTLWSDTHLPLLWPLCETLPSVCWVLLFTLIFQMSSYCSKKNESRT